MGGIGSIVSSIGSIVSGVAGVLNVFNPPKIKIPKVEIPTEDLSRINSAIEANKGLSDVARANVQQALEMYQEGKLTPQYQAMLDEWWNKQSTALAQRLAAMGLSNSTIAQTAYRELSTSYLTNMGNLLQKQLSDALSMAGLADDYKNSLMQKAQLQLQGKMAEANAYMQAQMYSNMLGQSAGQAYGNLASSLGTIGTLGQKTPPKTTTTTPTTTQQTGFVQPSKSSFSETSWL